MEDEVEIEDADSNDDVLVWNDDCPPALAFASNARRLSAPRLRKRRCRCR